MNNQTESDEVLSAASTIQQFVAADKAANVEYCIANYFKQIGLSNTNIVAMIACYNKHGLRNDLTVADYCISQISTEHISDTIHVLVQQFNMFANAYRIAITSRHDYAYMDMAIRWGLQSYAHRAKVGALIVKGRQIISDGFNGMPTGFSNECENVDLTTRPEVLHAESNAILKVAKYGAGSTNGATMYCTFSPCFDCSRQILQAGIKRVFYAEKYRMQTGLHMLESSKILTIQLQKSHLSYDTTDYLFHNDSSKSS